MPKSCDPQEVDGLESANHRLRLEAERSAPGADAAARSAKQ